MASLVRGSLKLPYEIGRFIAYQVPLDSKLKGSPWASHKELFNEGPNPFRFQMKQGLLLEVANHNQLPKSIYTRYGEWGVLESNNGSFDKVFEVIKKTLNLRKVEELSGKNVSLWAIQHWDGKTLVDPIRAKADEYISFETGRAAYKEFMTLNTPD